MIDDLDNLLRLMGSLSPVERLLRDNGFDRVEYRLDPRGLLVRLTVQEGGWLTLSRLYGPILTIEEAEHFIVEHKMGNTEFMKL